MYVCIVKGQGFISPIDTGRQRAHTPARLSLHCSSEIARPLSHGGRLSAVLVEEWIRSDNLYGQSFVLFSVLTLLVG